MTSQVTTHLHPVDGSGVATALGSVVSIEEAGRLAGLHQNCMTLGRGRDVQISLDLEELALVPDRLDLVGIDPASGGAVGKRLDFLMQELNRESNTLGSKSVSTDTTNVSIELKVLIEQMREQIQNIE